MAIKSKVKAWLNQADPRANEEIFQRYLRAYKKGVFNYIKDDRDQDTQQPIPRKYFSGGTDFESLAEGGLHRFAKWTGDDAMKGDIVEVKGIADLAQRANPDAAMKVGEELVKSGSTYRSKSTGENVDLGKFVMRVLINGQDFRNYNLDIQMLIYSKSKMLEISYLKKIGSKPRIFYLGDDNESIDRITKRFVSVEIPSNKGVYKRLLSVRDVEGILDQAVVDFKSAVLPVTLNAAMVAGPIDHLLGDKIDITGWNNWLGKALKGFSAYGQLTSRGLEEEITVGDDQVALFWTHPGNRWYL